MSFRKNGYADLDKWRATKRAYNKRYYARTSNSKNSGKRWTQEEIEIVVKHEKTDMELSKELGRSVLSIQKQRNKAKKG